MPMPVTKQSTWMQEVILYVLIQPPVAQSRFVLSLFEHGKLHEIGHVGLSYPYWMRRIQRLCGLQLDRSYFLTASGRPEDK